MNHTPPLLESLPDTNIKAIKDGWRDITSRISREKGLAEKVWANLRRLLSPEADKASLDQGILGAIARIMKKERNQIIELLQDKECIKRIVGVQYIKPKGRIIQKQQARQKQRRTKAAEMVLQEIEGKIQLHMSHIPAIDDWSIPEETATDELFRNARY